MKNQLEPAQPSLDDDSARKVQSLTQPTVTAAALVVAVALFPVSLCTSTIRGFSRKRGTYWGPHNKDKRILGFIGVPI